MKIVKKAGAEPPFPTCQYVQLVFTYFILNEDARFSVKFIKITGQEGRLCPRRY